MNGRRFFALLVKESRQILRDPSTFLIAFVLPLVLLFLFGYAVSLDIRHVDIGIALEDDSQAGQSLAMAFRNSRWFAARTARQMESLEDDLIAGRIRGIIVIPQDFGARLRSDERPAEIQIITDGSLPNMASFVANYAEGVRASWAAAQALDEGVRVQPPLSLEPRFWYNAELRSRDFLIPGSIAIVMAMIGSCQGLLSWWTKHGDVDQTRCRSFSHELVDSHLRCCMQALRAEAHPA